MSFPDIPEDCGARYSAVKLLGEGAYGRVYLALQRELARPVALKILRSEILPDADQRRRFVEEGRIVARLSHPNIVRVIDAGAASGTPWLVFELVDGPSLRNEIAKKRLSWRQALKVAVSVAYALDEAHRQGVVHRDVKAENVLRALDGTYKLADFGIARWTADSRVKTATGVFLGTPTHMAPELIRGGDPSVASDVYALGVLLFELLAGHLPFASDNLGQLFQAHLCNEIPTLSRLHPEIPHTLDRLLSSALAKHPDQRPRSARELAGALAQLVASRAEPPAAAVRAAPLNAAAMPRARSRHGLVGVLGLVAAITVAHGFLTVPTRATTESGPASPHVKSARAPIRADELAGTRDWLASENSQLNTLLEELAGRMQAIRGPDITLGLVPFEQERDLLRCFQRLVRRLAHLLASLTERRVKGPVWLDFCGTIATLRANVLAVGARCGPDLLPDLDRLLVRKDPDNPFQASLHAVLQAELRCIHGDSASSVPLSSAYASAQALLSESGPDGLLPAERYHFACLTVAFCRTQAALEEGGSSRGPAVRDLLAVTRRIPPVLRGPRGDAVANLCSLIAVLNLALAAPEFRRGGIQRQDMEQFVRDTLEILARSDPGSTRGHARAQLQRISRLAGELRIEDSPVRRHLERLPAQL